MRPENMNARIIGKVRQTIVKYAMIEQGDGIVVAVSGGPDSVCLLNILDELKDEFEAKLVVAHFDHGLRPHADASETSFVSSLARTLDLPFESGKADDTLTKETPSLEERARRARYHFLKGVKVRFSAQKIALGHHLDDQAETVLMRMLRGSGPSGLAGIPPVREGGIIRPLICLSRREIEGYLRQEGLEYRLDTSNLEPRFLRNQIRMKLLPQLETYQPRIAPLLGQMAEVFRQDDSYLMERAQQWLKKEAEPRGENGIQVCRRRFNELPAAIRNRVIRCALKRVEGSLRRITSRHLEAINFVAQGDKPQAEVRLPKELSFRRVYSRLIFSKGRDRTKQAFSYVLEGPGTFQLDALNAIITIEELESAVEEEFEASASTAFFSKDRIDYPLTIRNARPGDRFVPLGMRGRKKLKNFFMDHKIPSETRAKTPILISRDQIVWVCGLRIDERFKLRPDTKKVVRVAFKKASLK